MTPQTRTFRVAPGRVVIPPKGLLAGPGATPARFSAGQLLELPAASVDRFIRNRIKAGDLVEVKALPVTTPKKQEG